MATTVSVEAHRRRFSAKVTPMMPLSAVVTDVLGQLGLGAELRPEDCQLLLKGKPLDLTTPVRFANIGREKVELKTGREQLLGVQEASKPAAPTAPAAAAPAPPPPPQQQQQQQQPLAAGAPFPAPAPSSQQAQQQVTVSQQAGPSCSSALVAPAPAAPSQPTPARPPAVQPAAGPSGSGAAGTASAAAPVDSHPSVALFGRRVWVFTRQAEEEAEGGGEVEEVDESFYEFNETDLRRVMASQASTRAKQEGGHLMTAAMRAKEDQRRAASFGDVPIRLYLPGGQYCLQTTLPATSPLSAVLALARAAVAPGAAAGAYLFTTPPRQVLKDLSTTLYAAKLIPAAKVHVGVDPAKVAPGTAGASGTGSEAQQAQQAQQQLFRPEVLALVEAPPQRSEVMHSRTAKQAQRAQQAGGAGGGGAAGGAAAARQGGASGATQVQKGVPKWMKLGGK